MNDLLVIALILFGWIALNRWLLPALGIQTCMSGACCGNSCQVPPSRPAVNDSDEEIEQEVDSNGRALQ